MYWHFLICQLLVAAGIDLNFEKPLNLRLRIASAVGRWQFLLSFYFQIKFSVEQERLLRVDFLSD